MGEANGRLPAAAGGLLLPTGMDPTGLAKDLLPDMRVTQTHIREAAELLPHAVIAQPAYGRHAFPCSLLDVPTLQVC